LAKRVRERPTIKLSTHPNQDYISIEGKDGRGMTKPDENTGTKPVSNDENNSLRKSPNSPLNSRKAPTIRAREN
ncbi:35847_t:CDS:2, partial [Gigaspora margarita]